MAKQKETAFKEKIKPLIEKLPNTWVVKIQQRTLRGTPDLLICVNGLFVALELKKSDKEASDFLQDHNLDLINKAGGLGIKVYPENWDKVFLSLIALSKGEYHDRNYCRTT